MTWGEFERIIDPMPITMTALMILLGIILFDTPAIMPERPEEIQNTEQAN